MPGIAGIAWALFDLGEAERAVPTLALSHASPLIDVEPGVFIGLAGVGLADLRAFEETNDGLHLANAVAIGDRLLQKARRDQEGLHWPASNERVFLGYGFGASGIALFLAYLSVASGDARFASAALQSIGHDLHHSSQSTYGPSWRTAKDDARSPLLPYFQFGGSGVGAAALRIGMLLNDESLVRGAMEIADASFCSFSVFPGLTEGLAGIGEFMLDMWLATGESRYRSHASTIAETICLFGVPMPEGVAFPDRGLDRLSNSYAMGGAGIGEFLIRHQQFFPRRLLDFGRFSVQRP
jgi:hypothetical protein